nr:MAG TPA: hypothetical protein [Caudoviricetes sp.]
MLHQLSLFRYHPLILNSFSFYIFSFSFLKILLL